MITKQLKNAEIFRYFEILSNLNKGQCNYIFCRKLGSPFFVKFCGTALLKEGDQLRVIHALELCKENLMNHIFQNPETFLNRLDKHPPRIMCCAGQRT